MKIAMLHASLPSNWRPKEGGVTYFVHSLANKLVEKGHEVTMFAMDKRPDDALYTVQTINDAHWLHTSRLARYYLVPALFARLNLKGFDLVHSHGDDWLVGLGRKTPPRLRTLHGAALAEARNSESWKRRVNHLLVYQTEKLAARRATLCVANSRDTLRYFPGVKEVIGCGVDTSVFRPDPQVEKSQKPSILFVGSLEGRKRGQLLVDIFTAEVRSKLPEAELWLVTEQGVEAEGIRNFGKVSQQKLVELYRQAWVFCLPSTYEGFGIPYAEALASGVAVVSSPNPGSCEILDEGRYGIICEDSELPAKLVALLEDAPGRERMAEEGLERAKQYDWATITGAYEKLYQQLTRGN